MVKCGVFFEVATEFLNIIYMSAVCLSCSPPNINIKISPYSSLPHVKIKILTYAALPF
jgi:hypothetical protein